MDTKNKFYDSFKDIIDNAIEQHGSAAALSRATGISPANISRWRSGERIPRMEEISPLMNLLNVTLKLPSAEAGRDVCFVDARVVPAGSGQKPPEVEDYLAVPLVEEVGAGPGLIPQGELLSWFLVWRNQKSIRYKRDLIAVQIGKQSTSMLPTLKPEDIVLVDRQDRDVETPGHIMLVMDPDGSGMIKRVSIQHNPRSRDSQLTFYSDNAVNNPPMVYSVREDYDGDLSKAIVGRVVWAWSDVSNK